MLSISWDYLGVGCGGMPNPNAYCKPNPSRNSISNSNRILKFSPKPSRNSKCIKL